LDESAEFGATDLGFFIVFVASNMSTATPEFSAITHALITKSA